MGEIQGAIARTVDRDQSQHREFEYPLIGELENAGRYYYCDDWHRHFGQFLRSRVSVGKAGG
jgi:hypothetical protein